ncbi:MAG: DUF2063 domain-containing protein [Burkholderiales bacterium]
MPPSDLPAFQRYQAAFTAHIRDPKRHPRPAGTSLRRMRVYNELLFNNVQGFLLACFPITRKILGARRWTKLARAFFATHKCSSPLFRQIPEEFVVFLQSRPVQEPVFLAHFAHYEWIELAVDISPEEPPWDCVQAGADLMQGYPVLTPSLRLLEYPFQVHRISPKFQPKAPDPELTRVIVFRDQLDKVQFVVVNAVTARLLAFILENEATGEQACIRIAQELDHPNPAAVIAGGRGILEGLERQGAILGAKVAPNS